MNRYINVGKAGKVKWGKGNYKTRKGKKILERQEKILKREICLARKKKEWEFTRQEDEKIYEKE